MRWPSACIMHVNGDEFGPVVGADAGWVGLGGKAMLCVIPGAIRLYLMFAYKTHGCTAAVALSSGCPQSWQAGLITQSSLPSESASRHLERCACRTALQHATRVQRQPHQLRHALAVDGDAASGGVADAQLRHPCRPVHLRRSRPERPGKGAACTTCRGTPSVCGTPSCNHGSNIPSTQHPRPSNRQCQAHR